MPVPNTAKLDAKDLLGQKAYQEQRRTGHCDSGTGQEGAHLPAPDGQKRWLLVGRGTKLE